MQERRRERLELGHERAGRGWRGARKDATEAGELVVLKPIRVLERTDAESERLQGRRERADRLSE